MRCGSPTLDFLAPRFSSDELEAPALLSRLIAGERGEADETKRRRVPQRLLPRAGRRVQRL
jgi:hypothetical protein